MSPSTIRQTERDTLMDLKAFETDSGKKIRVDQRRAFPRRAAKGSVFCRTGKYGMGPQVKAKLEDLSPDGAGMLAPKEISVGERVELEFEGYGPMRRLILSAIVRFVAATGEGKWRLGCQFERRVSHHQIADYLK
ncbi:MAG: PilZ domain-containing protein [Planctomycetota bacterium]